MASIKEKHLRYKEYLESKNINYLYKEVFVDYIDTFSGHRKKYYIDFVLLLETPEWVEITDKLKPTDKRIIAGRRAKEAGVIYRCLTPEEHQLISSKK